MLSLLCITLSLGQTAAPKGKLRIETPQAKLDYPIICVRAPRTVPGKDGKPVPAPVWPDAGAPTALRASTDLMLLHPDGKDEALVEGGKGAIADHYVSFDARWVYFTRFHDTTGQGGADLFKVGVATKKLVRLTHGESTPNIRDGKPRRVWNLHPCPLPGGRVAFVSDRDGLKAPRHAQSALQLFVMDDDGKNIEKIGHLNVGQALHPVILKDGRIIFSSLEVQGKHNTGWGILGIHPDGTNWNPVVSALSLGGAPIPFRFQAQLSDESLVIENCYIPAMGGFGVYFKQPARPPVDTPPFGPAKPKDDPGMAMRHGRFRMPFQPYGMEVLTRFTHNHDSPALRAEQPERGRGRSACSRSGRRSRSGSCSSASGRRWPSGSNLSCACSAIGMRIVSATLSMDGACVLQDQVQLLREVRRHGGRHNPQACLWLAFS